MKSCLLLALLALTACGVDGPPERPAVLQDGLSSRPLGPRYGLSGNYTDERGVIRTLGHTVSVGGEAIIGAGVNL